MGAFEVRKSGRDPAVNEVAFGLLLVAYARGKRESGRLARVLNRDAEAVRRAELVAANISGAEPLKLWAICAGNVAEAKRRGVERSALSPQEVAADELFDLVKKIRGDA